MSKNKNPKKRKSQSENCRFKKGMIFDTVITTNYLENDKKGGKYHEKKKIRCDTDGGDNGM